MALARTGKFADSIAKPNGIYSKDGEMLIANDNTFYIHSKEFMDTWNGTKAPAKKAAPVVEEAPVYVADKVEEVVVAAKPAKKKKPWSKK